MIIAAMSIALFYVLVKFFIALFAGALTVFGIILRVAVAFVLAAIIFGMIEAI